MSCLVLLQNIEDQRNILEGEDRGPKQRGGEEYEANIVVKIEMGPYLKITSQVGR